MIEPCCEYLSLPCIGLYVRMVFVGLSPVAVIKVFPTALYRLYLKRLDVDKERLVVEIKLNLFRT